MNDCPSASSAAETKLVHEESACANTPKSQEISHTIETETNVIPKLEVTGSTDELDDDTVALVKEVRFDEFEKDIFLKSCSYMKSISGSRCHY